MNMKNNKPIKKKKEYYIHQIVRDNNNENNNSNRNQGKVNISIYSGVKNAPDYAENVGYHLDPRRYDALRKKKETNTYLYSDYEPKVETQNNNNHVLPEIYSDEDYYANMAEQYVEHDETVIEDVISEKEMEKDLPLEESTTVINKQGKTASPKTQIINHNKTKNIKKKKYVGPSLDMLVKGSGTTDKDISFADGQKAKIDEVLQKYGIKAHVAKYVFGPTVIMYLIEMETLNEDVKSIRKIEDNLSMYLECSNIRILTPIPNMRYAGIEIARPQESRSTVYLGDMLADREFKNSKFALPVAVGVNSFGEKKYVDIADMPHGLCAGATKSGKSVCLNAFIMSLLYHFTPSDIRLMLLDPKLVEFGKYAEIPHLAMPVITEQSYFESAVIWLTDEMERRYRILNKYGAVELAELNEELISRGEEKIPYIVMIMDEFNDWFIDASNTVNDCITRLMQKARAAGIHVILATQRPSADVIKGAIKANITTRLAFRVSSFADSSVILGQSAAEKLEGKGDMILRFPGLPDTRLQGAFVSNKEIKSVVEFLNTNNEVDYIVTLEELQQSSVSRGDGNGSVGPKLGRDDEYFTEVCYYVVRNQNASVNQLQKIFGTNFNRMDNIFKDMQSLGIVSPTTPGTKRKVLVNEMELEEILNNL